MSWMTLSSKLVTSHTIDLSFSLPKQQGGESVQSFYETLIEEIENCSRGNEENTLIRDTFKCNIRDKDTQKELHKEAVTPTKAVETTIHKKMGFKQQMGNSYKKINQNANINNTQSVKIFKNYQNRNHNKNIQQQRQNFNRKEKTSKQN